MTPHETWQRVPSKDAHPDELQKRERCLLRQLDGPRAARVAPLAGLTREQLDEAGGVRGTDDGGAGPRAAG